MDQDLYKRLRDEALEAVAADIERTFCDGTASEALEAVYREAIAAVLALRGKA